MHGRWTDEEHRLFLEGMERFKKDWRSIERHIGTRTCSQIRSHAQKYFMRLDKQQSHDGSSIVLESQQASACAAPVQRSATMGQEDYAEPSA